MSTATMSAGRSNGLWLGVGAVATVVTLGATLMALMSQGHAAFNTTGDGVSWGLPVVAYVYFSMLSTGLALVASLSTVFGVKEFAPIAKRCLFVAIGALVAGFVSLALEMGHPFRLLWAVPLNFQPQSALVWMGIFYGATLVIMALKFMKLEAGDSDSAGSKSLSKAAVVVEVLAIGTLGAAFGMMAMRPVWYGPEVPAMFLATACLLGVAGAALFTFMAYGTEHDAMPPKVKALMTGALPKALALVIAIAAVFVFYRAVTQSWSNADGLQAARGLGSAAFLFEFIICLLLPLYLMTSEGTRNNATMQLASAVLVLVGAFVGRYDFVVGGQIAPLFKGAWVDGLIAYTPSTTEWMVAGTAISLTILIYAIGEKMFDLGKE